ncbi:MAG: NAD(+) diphosphatase [Myxococcales bacterium]
MRQRRFVPSPLVRSAPRRGYWFAFRGQELLLDTGLQVLECEALEVVGLAPLRSQYLGELDGVACFSAELAPGTEPPRETQFHTIRSLFGRLADDWMMLVGRASQIVEWDRTHQFCGACGEPTVPHAKQRARSCVRCKLEFFPRISPAMIVAVERGPEILLARSPHFPPGIFSALAGFVDPGESVEEAVAREVREEVGIEIDEIRYFGSQPWPFPNSLMLGFHARYRAGDIVIDGEEIEQAAFFRVQDLPKMFPGRLSISQWLIHDFIARHGG